MATASSGSNKAGQTPRPAAASPSGAGRTAATKAPARQATAARTAAKKATAKKRVMTDRVLKRAAKAATQVAAAQRRIQQQLAGKKPASGSGRSSQAGPRRQPVKMPAQHLAKPGNEHALDLAPRYLAPDYQGSGKLAGMRALVTGGDSGIGRAVAVLFAREGADVAILHLDEPADAQVTCSQVEAEGGRCLVIAGDVRDRAFCDAAVAKVVSAFGGIDILVNNAAFQLHCHRLEDLGDAHLQQTLQTNIAGYIQMARAVLPYMQQGGSIINTGSETGIFGSSSLIDYSATKGAIHAFTKALASQLLPRGIRVNCVAPGPVWTPLNPADKSAAEVARFGQDSDMGRPAQPEELSPAYVFLASPVCASYISGVVLPVMGGPRG